MGGVGLRRDVNEVKRRGEGRTAEGRRDVKRREEGCMAVRCGAGEFGGGIEKGDTGGGGGLMWGGEEAVDAEADEK